MNDNFYFSKLKNLSEYKLSIDISQMAPRGRMHRYPSRNVADANLATGVGGGMLPVPYDMAAGVGSMPRDGTAATQQPMPITALASALANASPDQQRTVCIYTFDF